MTTGMLIVLAGLAVIWLLAKFIPERMPTWETYLGAAWTMFVGAICEVIYFAAMTTEWHQYIPGDKWDGMIIFGVGLAAALLRHVNKDSERF